MSDEKLTYLADVEVIADTCETMLKNSKIFEDIAQGNPTLAQKLKDKLKNFIARLKQLLNKTNALTHEGKLLEECVTEFEEIQKLWDKAVTDGIKTVNALHAEQKNNTVQNYEQYQLRGYSEKQIDNWSNSKNIIIYRSDSQLSVFIDDALAGKNLNQKMYFGTIDQQLANRIYNDTNVNVEGFNVVLRASEIRKILLHSHGNEAKENARGQRAITKEDILLIPIIISEPDKIVNAGQTKSNKPAIAFEKTIRGKTTVLSYVSDKHMDLTVQTMYSGKEKSLPTTADAKSPASTPETNSGTASNNSIFNVTENVNNDTKKFSIGISDSGVNDNIEYQQRYVEPATIALEERLQGDELLDAQDIIDTIKSVGGKVDEYGNAILYHGTNKNSRDSIYQSGKMIAKEDGLFFSTKPDGEIKGYGDNTVRVKIPVEYLQLDDIFNDEAHFRLPLGSDYSANVSSVLFQMRTNDDFLFDDKINKITQSQQFIRWFGDRQNHPETASKVVDSNGEPLVVYHQTKADFTIFNTDNERAGLYDSDTPIGMFFKTTDKNIGLAGNKQMAVYLNAKNVLTFNNRDDIHSYWMKNVPGYVRPGDETVEVYINASEQQVPIDLQEQEIVFARRYMNHMLFAGGVLIVRRNLQ